MTDTLSTRDAAIARMADVMRDYTAQLVFFQDAIARFGGLNSTDLQTVSVLMSQGPATPGQLAERTGLTTGGAITAVIDRLEKAGYVTRERDATDRRKVIVTANTATVFEKVGPIYGRIAARWGDYLATLSDAEIDFANELFTRATEVTSAEIAVLKESS